MNRGLVEMSTRSVLVCKPSTFKTEKKTDQTRKKMSNSGDPSSGTHCFQCDMCHFFLVSLPFCAFVSYLEVCGCCLRGEEARPTTMYSVHATKSESPHNSYHIVSYVYATILIPRPLAKHAPQNTTDDPHSRRQQGMGGETLAKSSTERITSSSI